GEIQEGNLVPADARQVGDAGEMPPAIHGDEVADNLPLRLRHGGKARHHAAHAPAIGGIVEQQLDGVLLPFGLDEAGVVDDRRIPVQLDGATQVDEHSGDSGLADIDEIPEKILQLDAGAHHTEDSLPIPHQHIDPQLGDAKHHVRVNVEVKLPA